MAWNLLFTSDIGLFSLFTIAFIILMAVYIVRYAAKHAKEEEKAKTMGTPAQGAH